MTIKNTTRAAAVVDSIESASKDIYAGAKSGRFTNGTVLVSGKIAKTKISQIESHVESINDYAGFAVYHAATNNNLDPLKRLFAAPTILGVRGSLLEEGRTLRQFIKKMTTGIDIADDGTVSRRMSGREGKKQEVAITFRVLVDDERVAGDNMSGFIMSYMEWRRIVKDNVRKSKNRESLAGTKAGELADGAPDGSEQAPAPSVDSKSGGPLPFASILAQLDQIKEIIANTGNGYSREDSKAAAGKLQELAHQLLTRDEIEAMAEEQKITADKAADMMAKQSNAA